MGLRGFILGFVMAGLLAGMPTPVWAQPELGVPFTYECVLWKEKFDPLPARSQRAILSTVGSVVFAGAVAVIDVQKILDLPFNPKLVVVGFFALAFIASLTDYWFTNQHIADMKIEGVELGCLEPEAFF